MIKNEKRTSLNSETLRDLLEIKTEGPPFSSFSADAAIDLWWKDSSTSTCRVQQKPRKKYKKRKDSKRNTTSSSSTIVTGEEKELAIKLERFEINSNFYGNKKFCQTGSFFTPAYSYIHYYLHSMSPMARLNWSAFLGVDLQPCKTMTGTLAPVECVNWV